MKGHPANEEYDEDHIRECGSDVDYLSSNFDPNWIDPNSILGIHVEGLTFPEEAMPFAMHK